MAGRFRPAVRRYRQAQRRAGGGSGVSATHDRRDRGGRRAGERHRYGHRQRRRETNTANDAASDTVLLTSHVVSWQSVETDSNNLGAVPLTIAPNGSFSEPAPPAFSSCG